MILVSEWITKRGVFELSTLDFAYRLYLIEINSGLSKAEKFFKSIPENMKDDTVYTTLLSFNTKSKKTRHEAEATYEKMKEKDLLFKPNPYYKMISLYCLLGEANMVDEVLRQMEENEVVHDKTLTENNNAKQGQRMGAYRRKGSGGRSSHHPGYYGGCGGGDGSRADDKVVVSVLILMVALAVDVIVVVVDVVIDVVVAARIESR
ncbi:hypothetical protein HID58_066069 [Brassica napus]|uniref:Pentatricopeptide repeat-containing protein n=2 Tax=Brassica napus TaxID=3708 RepID=A0ABQ7ZEL2_BRANA|nr:hypothetical protein HID58_066069 [Brassica napus]